MSQNTFRKIGDRIKGSPFALPIFIASLMGFIIGLFIFSNDMYTGYMGAKMAPIPADPTPVGKFMYNGRMIALAVIPQLVAYLGTYITLALEPENPQERLIKTITYWVTIVFIIVDILAGLLYYFPLSLTWQNIAANPMETVWAMIMAAVIDTLGSEVLVTVSFGILVQLKPHASKAWAELWSGGSSGSGGKRPPKRKNPSRGGRQSQQPRGNANRERNRSNQGSQPNPTAQRGGGGSPAPISNDELPDWLQSETYRR